MQKITIIGYGKMAKAIAVGLNGTFELEIIGRNKAKMTSFVRENALKNASVVCADLRDLSGESGAIDIEGKSVILAIKPYALDSFRYTGKARAIYSIMAGISIERLKKCADAEHFIRVMPNIASLVGKGVSVIFVENATNNPSLRDSATPNRGNLQNSTDSAIRAECESIFAPLGNCIFVEKESYINPAGAISGSGTAYLGLVAEAMIDAGVREGLSLEVSKELTRGLFSGFSALFTRIEAHTIRYDTTSPAGTTIEALAILENRGVRSAFMDAIHAANSKAKSIS